MNTVKLPGFTAEASLSITAERHRMLGARDPNANRGKVVPQSCNLDCVEGYCIWRCTTTHQV